ERQICRRGEDVGGAHLLRQPSERHVRPAEGVGAAPEAAARRKHVNARRRASTASVTANPANLRLAAARTIPVPKLVRTGRQLRPCPTDGLRRHGALTY